MPSDLAFEASEACHCLAFRRAARRVTQFYDDCMAASGLRVTQYSILSRLKRLGPMTINQLAAEMELDRTTLGRNILPLQRAGLIAVGKGSTDRRSKELRVTEAGVARLRAANRSWTEAQAQFEAVFGRARTTELRSLLREVTTNGLRSAPAAA